MSSFQDLNDQWKRFSSGREVDKEKLWADTLKYVYIIAKKLAGDDEVVDDVVQNTFVKLFRINFQDKNCIQNWPAYIFTIVKNCFRDLIKDRKEIVLFSVDPEEDPISNKPDTRSLDYIRDLETNELVKRLLKKIYFEKGKEWSDVFSLYLKGYKYREIAKATGINVNTVATYIYEIKKKYSHERIDL